MMNYKLLDAINPFLKLLLVMAFDHSNTDRCQEASGTGIPNNRDKLCGPELNSGHGP